MLTANRFHDFLNSARDWEALMKHHLNSGTTPLHRVACDEGAVVFEIDLPGYSREELDLEVEGNELQIHIKSQTEDPNVNWKLRERVSLSEAYRFELPFRIDSERTDASYENGILRLSIQKPAEEVPRKLTVK